MTDSESSTGGMTDSESSTDEMTELFQKMSIVDKKFKWSGNIEELKSFVRNLKLSPPMFDENW